MKKNWTYKRISSLVIVILLLLGTLSISSIAIPTTTYNFENFTEAQSLAFVEEFGIEIPSKLQQSEHLATFTKSLILQAYNDPDTPFCFNYEKTQKYAEDIRVAVRACLDRSNSRSATRSSGYSLRFSKVKDEDGNWVTSGGYYNPKWQYYNCYAFAINRAEQPAFYNTGKQYQPGDMSSQGTFDDCTTINQLAEIVRADLSAMGYSNISVSSTMPSINSSQELICVRMLYDFDYHFMRYDLATNAWYHKPGHTAVLKYNYTPMNNLIWYLEYSSPSGEGLSDGQYTSDIVYIAYSKNQLNVTQSTTSREQILPNKDVFCEIVFANSGYFDINLQSIRAMQYELYDEDFDIVCSGSGTSIDTCISATAGKYYLRINFFWFTNAGSVNISINAHSHNFNDSYWWHSYSQHKSTCACEEYQLSPHVIPAGSIISPGEYVTCMLCDGNASVGVYPTNAINGFPKTGNGSYILPNGVIVLAEDDIQAYMNGTIVFSCGETE